MGFKQGQGIIRLGLPTGGLVLLSLIFALGMFAGQARAAVPAGPGGGLPDFTLKSTQSMQPQGGAPAYGTVRIVINGRNPGSITWSPPGIKNFKPEDCLGVIHTGDRLVECYFPHGTSVTLTAKPDSGYVFAGWDGACKSAGSTCKVTAEYTVSVATHFIAEGDRRPPDRGKVSKKCKRAKKNQKRARAKLNRANRQVRKAKPGQRKARVRQKKAAQRALKRAKVKVKKAC